MKIALFASLLSVLLLSGCAANQTHRSLCKSEVDEGWQELDLVAADGFSGSVSYAKALSLLTAAKTMQTLEKFDSCVDKAKRARFYMAQARQGK